LNIGFKVANFLKVCEEKRIKLINENVEEFQGTRCKRLFLNPSSKIIADIENEFKFCFNHNLYQGFKKKLNRLHDERKWLVESRAK
jgi:hypothetical protein